ncbi:hypothetical protein [Flagellimonas amoyensis]|uniref:hypothetical protein n=1 Tax=Flagellimonas amoyensis TaxID=2169401 RepID=UPI000D368329|nr:hypothetical protein [Allomuricauda amoyensis]
MTSIQEKTVFNNQTFQALVVAALGILMTVNLFNAIFALSYISLLPFAVQATVLVLVLTKDKYAKSAINIWSMLLMVGSGFSLLSKIIYLTIGDNVELGSLFLQIIFVSIGIAVYYYNMETTEVVSIPTKGTNPPPQR